MNYGFSPFSAGDKVVAYCRYSEGDNQGLKNTSTEEQEHAIRQFCAQNGLELVKVYADPFASGRSVAKRDNYLEMLSYLLHGKKKDIAGVVLWDYERYGRNYDQATLDSARLRMAGYKIYSLQQPIADTSPFAKVMEAMFMASAQNQSDMISADVRRALQANFTKWKVIPRTNIPDGWIPVPVSMGFYSDGRPRTGYKAEPDPELLPRIKEAIKKRFQGATMDEMKKIIGGVFANKPRETIRKLMMKPLLYGEMTFGGTTMEDYCTPIIDRATFERLQVYNENAPRIYRKPQGHFSPNRPLLSDMLFCGVCGKKAFLDRRKAKGKTYETYYCNSYCVGFRREILDNLVIEKGIEILSDDNYQNDVQTIKNSVKTPFSDGMDNLSLTAEIAKIDRKIARISSAIEDSDEPPSTLIKRLAELEKERAKFTQITTLDSGTEEDKILAEANRLRLYILDVLKNKESSTDEIRTALSFFIHSVVIFPDKRVLIRHTLPAMAKVANDFRGEVGAPLPALTQYAQLFEKWYSAK